MASIPTSCSEGEPEAKKTKLSKDDPAVLMVCNRWLPKALDYSISFINRQLAILLARDGKRVYSMAVEATDEDKRDADKHNIELLLFRHRNKESYTPDEGWLNSWRDGFPQLEGIKNDISLVIGHFCPEEESTADAACGIQKVMPKAHLALFCHNTPTNMSDTANKDKLDKDILEYAQKASLVLSLGKHVHDDLDLKFMALDPREDGSTPIFQVYIPGPDDEVLQQNISHVKMESEVNVLTVANNSTDTSHFELIKSAMVDVAETNHNNHKNTILTVGCLDTNANKGTSKDRHLQVVTRECTSLKKLITLTKQCNLIVDPDVNKPFSLTALHCIATATPVLVNGNSGFAQFIEEEDGFDVLASNAVVDTGINFNGDIEMNKDKEEWKKLLYRTLDKYDVSLKWASMMKDALNKSITSGRIFHCRENFVKCCNSILSLCKDDEKNETPSNPVTGLSQQLDEDKRIEQDRDINPGSSPKHSTNSGNSSHNPTGESCYEHGRVNIYVHSGEKQVDQKLRQIENLKTTRAQIEAEGDIETRESKEGCLILPVICKRVRALDRLWSQMWSGELNQMIQKEIVTPDFLQSVNLTEVKLTTNILTWEYNRCRAELILVIGGEL
ncbi:uncharacterized protein LOC102800835 [Saccoglossus kowalevskii]